MTIGAVPSASMMLRPMGWRAVALYCTQSKRQMSQSGGKLVGAVEGLVFSGTASAWEKTALAIEVTASSRPRPAGVMPCRKAGGFCACRTALAWAASKSASSRAGG